MFDILYSLFYYLILIPLCTLILVHILNQVLSWHKLKHYSAQGIETAFFPMLGHSWPLAKGIYKFTNGKCNSAFTDFAEFCQERAEKGGKMVVTGGYTVSGGWGSSFCMINDTKLLKSLTNIEMRENYRRPNLGGEGKYTGFVFSHAKEVLDRKATFQAFTNKMYIAGLFPGLKDLALKKITKIKELNKLDNAGQTKGKNFDIKPYIFELMTEYLEFCMFEGKEYRIDGKSVAEWADEAWTHFMNFMSSPINALTFGQLAYGSLKNIAKWVPFTGKWDQNKSMLKLEDTVMQALGPLMKLPDSELGSDIPSCIVREIRRRGKVGAKPYTKEEYVSDIGGYSWAGIDTTHGNLTSWFSELAMDHGLQNLFLGKIQNWFADPKTKQFSKNLTLEDLEAPEDYSHIISEILRFVDVAVIGFPRVFPRDIEVDGIKFKKGDTWSIGLTGIHKNSNISPDPHNFKIDRFVPGKGPEGQEYHKPVIFGAGKRICGGYQLADVFLKLTSAVFVSAFEFNMGSNWCELEKMKVVRCREELNVNLRCRPEFWTTDDIVSEYGSV